MAGYPLGLVLLEVEEGVLVVLVEVLGWGRCSRSCAEEFAEAD